jgi:hypothetical protein
MTLLVNRSKRLIVGRAAPYDSIGRASAQLPRRFSRGSLTWGDRLPLLIEHDSSLRVGRVDEFFDLPKGFRNELWVILQLSKSRRGHRGLTYAEEEGCGLSIGLGDGAKFRIADDGVNECVSAHIVEITLTRNPVFR